MQDIRSTYVFLLLIWPDQPKDHCPPRAGCRGAKMEKRAPPRGGGATDKCQHFSVHAYFFGSYGSYEEEKEDAPPREGGRFKAHE